MNAVLIYQKDRLSKYWHAQYLMDSLILHYIGIRLNFCLMLLRLREVKIPQSIQRLLITRLVVMSYSTSHLIIDLNVDVES